MKRRSGYSLLELLVAVAVVAVLAGLGLPALRGLALDGRLRSDINAFVGSIALARSEAAKRAATVTVCASTDGARCADAETGFEAGWIVIVGADSGPAAASGDRVLLVHDPAMTGTIRSNRARFRFRPFYRRSTNGTVSFCDERGARAARAVIVSYTGRPRVVDARSARRPLTCGT
jgi:type IV fimbrial biogenesis protein FimT